MHTIGSLMVPAESSKNGGNTINAHNDQILETALMLKIIKYSNSYTPLTKTYRRHQRIKERVLLVGITVISCFCYSWGNYIAHTWHFVQFPYFILGLSLDNAAIVRQPFAKVDISCEECCKPPLAVHTSISYSIFSTPFVNLPVDFI